jgi:hypothetical protein
MSKTMSINLEDIRTSVMNYVDSNVTITVTNLISAGTTINPGEGFSFKLNASNANAASGGVPLKTWFTTPLYRMKPSPNYMCQMNRM